jgi:hypothetical protein
MLAGLILLIFATIWLRSLVQPQSRGHTIEFWVQRYNDSRLTGLGAEEAQSAIRGIGTNGLPALLSMLEAKDPWWKPKLTEFLTKQLRLKVRVKSAQTKNWQAAAAYEVLGDTAAPQVPQLISLLEKTSDPYRRNSWPPLSALSAPRRDRQFQLWCVPRGINIGACVATAILRSPESTEIRCRLFR